MSGISSKTGQILNDFEHLRQSILDILRTPIGSRVMNREYGSGLFELIDQPINNALKVAIVSATYRALRRWEPRFTLEEVLITEITPGSVTMDIVGYLNETGEHTRIPGLVYAN